jgi:uncharacterized protein
MIKYLILILIHLTMSGYSARTMSEIISEIPNPRMNHGWVYDGAGVLGKREAEINSFIDALEKENGSEIALVILPSIEENNQKEFAVELFNTWKIGKRELDNGILILHVLDQRRVEIETGYGMEGILTDLKCSWIIREIAIPFFKEGSLADGHLETVKAVIRGIRNPDITKEALVSGIETEPGRSVQEITTDDVEMAAEDSLIPSDSSETEVNPYRLSGLILFAGALIIFTAWRYLRLFSAYKYYDAYRFLDSYTLPIFANGVIAGGVPAEFVNTGRDYNDILYVVTWIFSGAIFATLLGRFHLSRMKRLKTIPRVCNNCTKEMRLLDEKADDAFLLEGQRVEEKIESRDYNIWLCECGNTQIETYEGKRDYSFDTCEKCNYQTSEEISSTVLKYAGSQTAGLRLVKYRCRNCGHTGEKEVRIPPTGSSSSSSSSSSSHSSGSFGGGRSGGGGAGGSY